MHPIHHHPHTRIAWMDALRASLFLLGVFFHAAESFIPGRDSWVITDRHTHWGFELFQHLCHSFRMQVFFILAGFFAAYLLRQRGLRVFIHNRSQRLLLPFLTFWPILFVLVNALWLWGAKCSGRIETLGLPPDVVAMPSWMIAIGMVVQPEVVAEHFSLMHLWFLYYLILFCAVFAILGSVGMFRSNPHAPGASKGENKFSSILDHLPHSILLTAALFAAMCLMKSGGVDTPNTSLIPEPGPFALYGILFSYGWLLHARPENLSAMRPHWKRKLICGLSLLVLLFRPEPVGALLHLDGSTGLMVYRGLYAFAMALLVTAIPGAFQGLQSAAHPTWRYLADASYWIYLVHIPLIFAYDVAVADLNWPLWLKYSLECLTVLLVTLISYHYGVRYTRIGAFLNGRIHPRPSPLPKPTGQARSPDAPTRAAAIQP
jgi:hypothetical protein